MGGAAHEVRASALVNADLLLRLRRVDGQAEAEPPVVGALVGDPSREYRYTHAISFRMIEAPWSWIVWGPCLLGKRACPGPQHPRGRGFVAGRQCFRCHNRPKVIGVRSTGRLRGQVRGAYSPLSIAAVPPVSERLAVRSAVRSRSPYIRPRTGRSVVKNPVELIRCHMHRERRCIQLRIFQRWADVPHRHLVSEAVRGSQVVPDDGADCDRDLIVTCTPVGDAIRCVGRLGLLPRTG